MALSKEEIESLRHESKKIEHKKESSIEKKPRNKKKIMFYSVSSMIVVLIAVAFGFNFVQSQKPGALDSFAQCLTDKGAIMYGATFCQYSHAQKGLFGNSVKFLDVRDFSKDPNVRVTPTWLINGQYYENVQSFDRLATVTGCVIG